MFLATRKGGFQLKGTTMTAGYQRGHLSSRQVLLFAMVCISPWVCSAAYAQKGMGDQVGVARQGLKPPMTQLSGQIVSIETHPCEKTTGPALAGTHLIVEGTEGKQYNLHLGPANAVAPIVEPLQPGKQIQVVAFRTSQMPENQYVVTTLRLEDGKVLVLRDSDLRPFWSRWGGPGRGSNQGFAGRGQGRGFGRQSRCQSTPHRGPWCGSRRGSGRRIF